RAAAIELLHDLLAARKSAPGAPGGGGGARALEAREAARLRRRRVVDRALLYHPHSGGFPLRPGRQEPRASAPAPVQRLLLQRRARGPTRRHRPGARRAKGRAAPDRDPPPQPLRALRRQPPPRRAGRARPDSRPAHEGPSRAHASHAGSELLGPPPDGRAYLGQERHLPLAPQRATGLELAPWKSTE